MRAMSFFFSSRRRHTRWPRDWSSDVCSSDLRDYADWRPIPSELLEQNEVCKAVQDAINSLNPSYREVLVLRDIQNLSIKETTAILGISEANVKTRLHRARLLLRDSLAPGIDGCWIKGQRYKKVRPW